jgi:hypothetical protein
LPLDPCPVSGFWHPFFTGYHDYLYGAKRGNFCKAPGEQKRMDLYNSILLIALKKLFYALLAGEALGFFKGKALQGITLLEKDQLLSKASYCRQSTIGTKPWSYNCLELMTLFI